MAKLTPVSWQYLVKRLSELGFEIPFSGGKRPQMRRGNVTLILPNPHKVVNKVQLRKLYLKMVGIAKK